MLCTFICIYMDTYFLTCINTMYESILYHVDHMNMLASFFLVVSNVPFPGLSLIFCTGTLSSARPKWCSLCQVVVLFLRWSPLPCSLCLELWLPQPLQTMFILLRSLLRQEQRPLLTVSSKTESRPQLCALCLDHIFAVCYPMLFKVHLSAYSLSF